MHIVKALSERAPDAAVLIMTGSPAAHALGPLPQNVDYLKIPTLARTGEAGARPPHLPIEIDEVSSIRERLVCEALDGFRPDVFVVDTHPLGTRRELRPALSALRGYPTRAILGLRDIVDDPEAVRASWTSNDVYTALERLYDRILVYGHPDVLEIVEAYGLTSAVGAKTHYCGYVTAEPPSKAAVDRIVREMGVRRPLVAATVGGGGDGFPLLRDFVAAMKLVPQASAVAVTGPMMGPVDRRRLAELGADCDRCIIRDVVDDLPALMAAADVVISMCGYNTAAELMALRKPAIVVPRNWRFGEHQKGSAAGLELEQPMRARALAKLGIADLIPPEELTPRLLAERIRVALEASPLVTSTRMDIAGAESAADHILALAAQARSTNGRA